MQVIKDKVEIFRKKLSTYQDKIKSQTGCMQHDVFCDKDHKEVFYSYTIWDSEKNLNKYRKNELIKEINNVLSPLCIREPQAWTIDKVFE